MADPVVHFEIPANDVKRAKKFYEAMFGWKIEYLKDMDYYVIKAESKDPDGKAIGINGGMMKRKMAGQMFMNYIHVKSVDATLKKAVANGAKVAFPKMPIGGMGFIAAIIDPEGNCVGLHEMTPPKKTAAKKVVKKAAKKKKR